MGYYNLTICNPKAVLFLSTFHSRLMVVALDRVGIATLKNGAWQEVNWQSCFDRQLWCSENDRFPFLSNYDILNESICMISTQKPIPIFKLGGNRINWCHTKLTLEFDQVLGSTHCLRSVRERMVQYAWCQGMHPHPKKRAHLEQNSRQEGRIWSEIAQVRQAHPIELLEASLNPSRDPERLPEGKADPSEGYPRLPDVTLGLPSM